MSVCLKLAYIFILNVTALRFEIHPCAINGNCEDNSFSNTASKKA